MVQALRRKSKPHSSNLIFFLLHQMLVPSKPFLATVLASSIIFQGELNFELGNGSVKLQNPIEVQGTRLKDPQFLGAGGGGAVFAYSRINDSSGGGSNDVAVKVSWLRSTASVLNECKILQELETNHVTGVEVCLGSLEYPDDPRRAIIVMEPVIDNAVSSLSEIPSKLQPQAVDQLIRTMIQMLAANIVTTDVQPLISPTTGQVILIDMTEAKAMKAPLSFVDLALVSSFCTEIISLIPENLLDVASTSLLSEMKKIEENGTHLPNEVYKILQSQSILSPAVMEYLDKIALQ